MYRAIHPNHPGMHNTIYSDRYDYTQMDSKQKHIKQIKYNVVISLVGFAIIIASTVLIFWNEGQAIVASISIKEGLQSVKELSFIGVSQEENNNKLVHLTGKLSTERPLVDEQFGFSLNTVHLSRKVELFQWVESEIHTINREVPEDSKNRIEVSFAYDMQWRDTLVNDQSFSVKYGHVNPKKFPVTSQVFTASVCKVGQFTLSGGLVNKISNYMIYNDLPEPTVKNIKLHEGRYYKLQDPNGDVLKPQVGDIRIQYSYAGKTGGEAEVVSIIAKQHNLQLLPYVKSDGKVIELLYYGHVNPEDILASEGNHDYAFTVLVRCMAWFLSFFGFTCLSNLLTVISRKITVLRIISLVGSYSLRIVLSTSLTFSLAAAFWFQYEPIMAIVLLIISSLPYMLAVIKLKLRYNSSHRNV